MLALMEETMSKKETRHEQSPLYESTTELELEKYSHPDIKKPHSRTEFPATSSVTKDPSYQEG